MIPRFPELCMLGNVFCVLGLAKRSNGETWVPLTQLKKRRLSLYFFPFFKKYFKLQYTITIILY